MKRITSLFLVMAIFCLTFTACGEEEKKKTTSQKTSSSQTSTEGVESEDISSKKEDESQHTSFNEKNDNDSQQSSDESATSGEGASSENEVESQDTSSKEENNNDSQQSSVESTTSSEENTSSDTTEEKEKPIIKPTKSDKDEFKVNTVLKSKNNKMQNIKLNTDGKVTYKKYEIEMDIPNIPSSYNVFDKKDFDLSIKLVSSTGVELVLPGFYFEEYAYNVKGQQTGRTKQEPDFRLRFSFTEEGTWNFVISLKYKGKEVDSASGYINVTRAEDNRGFLHVEPVRKQIFQFDDGTPYAVVGQNTAYPVQTRANYANEYIGYMKKSAEYGANYTRFWLTSFWLSFQKNTLPPSNLTDGMADGAHVDRIFDALEEMDMYASFTLFTHNMFGTNIPASESSWRVNPYNAIFEGGYLEKPEDFFTNEKAKYDTKIYFRYLVARYGYSRNIMAWEFFNEADLTDGDDDDIREWHVEMSEYIRSIDPYNHMLTTSTGSKENFLNVNITFDFMSIHWYNYGTVTNLVKFQKEMWQIYKKPVIFGECGLNKNVEATIDNDLINFHQQNWAGLMGGGGGTATNWYWMKLDETGGYWDFQVVSEMAEHIPWNEDIMFMVATNNVKPSNEQVEVIGYRGNDYAYLWLYDSGFSHMNKVVTEFKDLTFKIKLEDGKYHVRWINSWTGVSMGKSVETAVDGELVLKVPKWSKDIAVTITTD